MTLVRDRRTAGAAAGAPLQRARRALPAGQHPHRRGPPPGRGSARAARLLPPSQGLVFPGGYELADGTGRTFRTDTEGLRFEAAVPSPNGEDLLYVFRHPTEARTLLLPWNTVRREAAGPLTGTAHALLADGALLLLRPAQGPTRAHDAQVWRTPFASAEYAAAQPMGDGPLERIGNAELVRGLAACSWTWCAPPRDPTATRPFCWTPAPRPPTATTGWPNRSCSIYGRRWRRSGRPRSSWAPSTGGAPS